jgi:hypothetical protein
VNIHASSSRDAFTASKETHTVTPRRRFSSVLSKLLVALCAAVVVGVAFLPAFAGADEPYAVKTFSNRTIDSSEAPYAVAGGHPDLSVTQFSVPLKELYPAEPVEVPNGTYIKPPVGFLGNPAAAPRCPFSKIPFSQEEGLEGPNTCPAGSQVGYVYVTLEIGGGGCTAPCEPGTSRHPLYNLPPERGYPAQFGFKFLDTPTTVSVFPQPRTEAYGLTVATPNIPAIHLSGFKAVFWGTPSDHGSGNVPVPFLSNQVTCSVAEPKWSIALDSVENAGPLRELGAPDLSSPNWKTASEPSPPVTGCDDPLLADQFAPTVATKPLSLPAGDPVQADAPTGLAVELNFPQTNDPTDLNTTFDPSLPQAPEPKDITVQLPAGVSVSPSSADGLGACSDQASNPAGDQVHYDTTKPVTCPDSSKIGSAVATTPLLATHDPITDVVNGAEPINGSVYLLKPHPGDFVTGQDGKFRLLIQLENERYGVNFKLPGIATADKETGQITTVFTENPQLPASSLTLNLKPGPRAPLMTSVTCGKFDTTSTLVPWSTPGTPDAHPSASFNVGSGPNGTGCPANAAARPFSPTVETAGPDSAKAGVASPFTLKVTRRDGDQELSSLNVTTPPGFTAKLKGVVTCPDAAIAAAQSKTGAEERANPSCPASSEVGTVTAGAGPGSNPFYSTGKVFLAGPYKGAPLSFAFITPVVAGPLDLGDVVVRAAVQLNSETTQVTVKTDPLPRMLDGVPLRLRSLETRLDRSDFTLNPTDCEPMSVSASVGGSDGATSNSTTPFQVGGCKDLGFKPSLKLALKGPVGRRAHPSLKATLTGRPGDANIASAQVRLPKAAFLDNDHIGQICTRPQFSAHQCPAGSVYGTATATTPLLGYELSGNVYLRANPAHKLPDLVVGFNGPASQPIEIELAGKTDSVKGALRNTFEAVPDVPVTKFSLTLFGGKKGLIEMSSGFCANPKADVKFTGQNGAESDSTPKVAAKCPKAKKGKGKGKAHKSAARLVPRLPF